MKSRLMQPLSMADVMAGVQPSRRRQRVDHRAAVPNDLSLGPRVVVDRARGADPIPWPFGPPVVEPVSYIPPNWAEYPKVPQCKVSLVGPPPCPNPNYEYSYDNSKGKCTCKCKLGACPAGKIPDAKNCECQCLTIKDDATCQLLHNGWWYFDKNTCQCECKASPEECACPPDTLLPMPGEPCSTSCGCALGGDRQCEKNKYGICTLWLPSPAVGGGQCDFDGEYLLKISLPMKATESYAGCLAEAKKRTDASPCSNYKVKVKSFTDGTCGK